MTSLTRLNVLLRKLKAVRDVMFNKYLLLTNVGISTTLSGAGDFLRQHYSIIQGEKDKWDKKRTHHMTITGMTVGFLCHHWYNYLDKALPGSTIKVALKKVVVDQLIFSPLYICVFFLTMGFLEKSSMEIIRQEIIEKGVYLYTAEWIVWPPAQMINFYFLPTKYRVLYDNTISLGYDIYTSHIKHDFKQEPSEKS